jgi:gamma-D-glutamyl-L-lysine dipeptidyl-peptidase
MTWATCLLSVVPMRREADLISEITSQVRLGEAVTIEATSSHFWRVRSRTDDYVGWVDQRHFTEPNDVEPPCCSFMTDALCGEATHGKETMLLPLGTLLPQLTEGTFRLGHQLWVYQGPTRDATLVPRDAPSVLTYARRLLRAPYLWGGRTVFGIDCSGFVQSVMAAHGIRLKRDSVDQVTQGSAVPSLEAAAPGDLLFFHGTSHHVGILAEENTVLHASGRVRLDHISPCGITNVDTGLLTHELTDIRRVL